MDGIFALKKIAELKPDVITLDLDMPRMDGLETLRHIVGDFGIPTIMVSSLTRKDADLTFRALSMGAFDFVAKPQDAISIHISEIGEELVAKVRAAARQRRLATARGEVSAAAGPGRRKSRRKLCPGPGPSTFSPSGSQPAGRMPSATCYRSSRRISRPRS